MGTDGRAIGRDEILEAAERLRTRRLVAGGRVGDPTGVIPGPARERRGLCRRGSDGSGEAVVHRQLVIVVRRPGPSAQVAPQLQGVDQPVGARRQALRNPPKSFLP